jgi:hypothetical protein
MYSIREQQPFRELRLMISNSEIIRHTTVSDRSGPVAQRQLRHSDASTTLGHYGHILGNDHRDAIDAVESVLSQPND